MSKRKTRQEKIIADLKRQLLQGQQVQPAKKITLGKKSLPIIVRPQTSAITYPYLVSDLRKTAFLTSFLIALELILYFLLQQKILVIPFNF